MGPDHVAAHVRGVATGCQGRGLGPVRHRQLVDGLRAHGRLHSPGGQLRPLRAVFYFHGGMRGVSALHRLVRPRDPGPISGGNRELFQGTQIYD